MPYLSVILPAYNEASAIQAGKLRRVVDWLEKQPFSSELLVVDDGSQDETASLAEKEADRLIRISHAGKAAAIVAGAHEAAGEFVLFSDMDQATPIHQATKLLEALENGAQVAIGSRGVAREGAPVGRYLLSWGQVALRWMLLGLKITDTQCGFKAFHREIGIEIIDQLQVYNPDRQTTLSGPSVTSGFDTEFLFTAMRLGFRIQEVPVIWNYQETRRVRLIRDALRGIVDLLRIFTANLQGKYPSKRQ